MRRRVTESIKDKKQAVKVIRELDAFPKVPESYQVTSTSGGTVSILTFLFIGILVFSEFLYYRGTEMKYAYEVDKETDSKIRINVDMTVAMRCSDIGADVLDLSGTSIDTQNNLKLEDAYFEMSTNQKSWWKMFKIIRNETASNYRTINEVLEVMSVIGGKSIPTYMPKHDASEFAGKSYDACRIFGNIEVNKVAGNFHITAGKAIQHPRGHAHLSALVSDDALNFSHRIDLLSFGEPNPGIVNPLDGELQTTENNHQMYQYYIKIVPTSIHTLSRQTKTNQFSVTQRIRAINHASGSHGVAGIFFKYDLSSIKVSVKEHRRPFGQFLIRLCGIIGGIFATSGMLHSFVGFLFQEHMKHSKNISQLTTETRNAEVFSSQSQMASELPPKAPVYNLATNDNVILPNNITDESAFPSLLTSNQGVENE